MRLHEKKRRLLRTTGNPSPDDSRVELMVARRLYVMRLCYDESEGFLAFITFPAAECIPQIGQGIRRQRQSLVQRSGVHQQRRHCRGNCS
jgi:hypothetical protein